MAVQLQVRVKFEPRDVWVGVYVAKPEAAIPWTRRVYMCLIPMLPLVVSWTPAVRM